MWGWMEDEGSPQTMPGAEARAIMRRAGVRPLGSKSEILSGD